jgi:hypothetical protein
MKYLESKEGEILSQTEGTVAAAALAVESR